MMTFRSNPADDFEPDTHGYDPWNDVDEALDAGVDAVSAQFESDDDAMDWLIALSAGSREEYLREYEAKRSQRPDRKRDRHKDGQATYMRAYRARKAERKQAA